MAFYSFKLTGLPHIWFAHRFQSEHYDRQFPSQPRALECTYILDGAALWHQQGREPELLPPGTLLVSPREIPFTISCPTGHHVHETVGMFLPLALKGEGENVLRIPTYLLPGPDTDAAVRILRRIIQAHALRTPEAELECSGLALELVATLARAARHGCQDGALEEDPSPGYERYARQALNYIAQHLEERITVSELAKQLKISPGHLSHVFKEATGQTLVTAINRMKLDRMQELMVARGLPLKQAAASVGWEDESYASRLFKQHYGLSPTQYLHTYTLEMP